MPLLYLSKHELLTLSSCSRIKPDRLSPLTRIYAEGTLDYNSEKMQEAAKELLNSKYIVDNNGKKLLAKKLEPAFFILHKPEKVVSFKRLSFADINEIYFSIRSGAAVEYITRYDSLFETLMYPYSSVSITKWTEQELFKDIKFEDRSVKTFDVDLTIDETILLFIVINIYRQRIIKSQQALSSEDTWITFRHIKEFEGFDNLKGVITLLFNKNNIKTYLNENDNIPHVTESLIEKGLMIRSEKGLSYSDTLKEIFDPGNVTDTVITKEVSERTQKIASLNILSGGYMLFSQAENNLDYRIQTFNKDIPLKELTEKMFSVELPAKTTRFCNNCGIKLSPEATFCNNCGIKLKEETGFCNNCGIKLSPGAMFCNNCGNKI